MKAKILVKILLSTTLLSMISSCQRGGSNDHGKGNFLIGKSTDWIKNSDELSKNGCLEESTLNQVILLTQHLEDNAKRTKDGPVYKKFDVKEAMAEITKNYTGITGIGCKNYLQTATRVGLGKILKSYYEENVFKNIDDKKKIINWDGVPDYLDLVHEWLTLSRRSVTVIDKDSKALLPRNLQADFLNEVYYPFMEDIFKYDVDWQHSYGMLSTSEVKKFSEEKKKLTQFLDVTKTLIKVKSKVLTQLFKSKLGSGDEAAVTGIFLSDMVSPIFKRAKGLTPFYDFACSVSKCDSTKVESGSNHQLISMIASWEPETKVKDVNESFTEDDLGKLLQILNMNKKAIQQITSKIYLNEKENPLNSPATLYSFTEIVREASTLIKNYEATKVKEKIGRYSGQSYREMKSTLSNSSITKSLELIEMRNSELATIIEKIKSDKERLEVDALTIFTQQGDLIKKGLELSSLERNIQTSIQDVEALKASILETRRDLTRKSIGILNSPEIGKDKNLLVRVATLQNLKLNAKDIRSFSLEKVEKGSEFNAMPTIASIKSEALLNLQDSKNTDLKLKKGDYLTIEIQGEWSATCALYKKFKKGRETRLGPLGLMSVQDTTNAKIQSVENYKFNERYKSLDKDANGTFGFAGYAGSFGASVRYGSGIRSGSGHRESNSTTHSESSVVVFNVGMNLEDTPVYWRPAGSVLLVETQDEGKGEFIRKIHLMDRTNFVNVSSDSTRFYLIGNDCASEENSGELTMQISHSRPQKDQGEAFIASIDKLTQEIESREAKLIQAGQIDAHKLQVLEEEILGRTEGVDLSKLEGSYQSLLKSYVHSKVNVIYYLSQIEIMERKIKNDFDLLVNQKLEQKQNKHLVERREEMRNELLGRLDTDLFFHYLDTKTTMTSKIKIEGYQSLLRALNNDLGIYLNFVHLIDPNTEIFDAKEMASVLELSPSDSFLKVTETLNYLVKSSVNRISEYKKMAQNRVITHLGLRLLNPFFKNTKNTDKKDRFTSKIYDEGKSKAFWNQLIAKTKNPLIRPSLEIELRELYGKKGQFQHLGCNQAAPLVEALGFYLVVRDEESVEDYNKAQATNSHIFSSEGEGMIPYASGPQFLKLNNPLLSSFMVNNKGAASYPAAMEHHVAYYKSVDEKDKSIAGRPVIGKFLLEKAGFEMHSEKDVIKMGGYELEEIKEVDLILTVSSSMREGSELRWYEGCK